MASHLAESLPSAPAPLAGSGRARPVNVPDNSIQPDATLSGVNEDGDADKSLAVLLLHDCCNDGGADCGGAGGKTTLLGAAYSW